MTTDARRVYNREYMKRWRMGLVGGRIRHEPLPLPHLSVAQYAYLAGLIDGEGSVEAQTERHPHGANPRFVIRISFVFATEEPTVTVANWLGLVARSYASREARHSGRWRLHVPRTIALHVLARCLPYLILKRRQAELVIAIERVRAQSTPSRSHRGSAHFLRMPEEAVSEMRRMSSELRSLKSNKRRH